MQYCLRLLTARAYTRSELAKKLTTRGFAEDTIDIVLDRLVELNLVDDLQYAQQWTQSRHMRTGRGRTLLANELRRKGVAESDVQAAIGMVSDSDEQASAAAIADREFTRITSRRNGPVEPADIRRVVAKLIRRGFSPALAYAVARKWLNSLDAESIPASE